MPSSVPTALNGYAKSRDMETHIIVFVSENSLMSVEQTPGDSSPPVMKSLSLVNQTTHIICGETNGFP